MKTLAIRLEDEQHARLTILAKLSDVSVTDTIRAAIDTHLATLAADPELSAKAEGLTAAIDREAAEQREAIAALFAHGPRRG
jgi:predicted transcriptional regulator